MALSDDYDFKEKRIGPKLFTEYSFGAIMVFVAQVGTALSASGQCFFFAVFSYVFEFFFPEAGWFPTLTLIPALAVLIVSLYEILLVYRLHTFGFTENNRIVSFNAIIIVAEIALLISLGFTLGILMILMIQTSAIIFLLNFLSIYLLRKEDIQMEFKQNRDSA